VGSAKKSTTNLAHLNIDILFLSFDKCWHSVIENIYPKEKSSISLEHLVFVLLRNMAFGPKVSEVSKTTSVVGGYLVFAGLVSYYVKENLYIRRSTSTSHSL
jgi:hypothetical protein